jgi:putative Mn2+ efflux pump MntP
VIEVILIGLSLSVDALAVALCAGMSIGEGRLFHALRISAFFGFFQFAMPVAGWYAGSVFAGYIEAFDHWAAFGLLAFVGGKMLLEALRAALRKDASPAAGGGDLRRLPTLIVLAFATSIDAFAVGLSFSVLRRPIWGPSLGIGAGTLGVCFLGFQSGRRIGTLLGKWAQAAGGLALIGLGLKILLEG